MTFMERVERKLAFETHLRNKACPHFKRQKHLTWIRFRVNIQRRGDKEKASKMCLQNGPSTHAQNDNSEYVNVSKDFMSHPTCPILLLLCQGHFISFYSIPSPVSRCLTHLRLLLTGLSPESQTCVSNCRLNLSKTELSILLSKAPPPHPSLPH